MGFITFIGGIAILVLVLNLRGRVKKLEHLIRNGAPQRAPESSYQPQPKQFEAQHPASSGSLIDQVKQQLSEGVDGGAGIQNFLSGPVSFDKFIEWLKEDWMLKLGALLLLIGFGWLTTFAFLANWIGPMGRIALGIIAGTLFIALGWWRIQKYVHQGGIFLVLGSTTILLTTFAARMIYDFFNPSSALAIMFISTAFVALASVKYNNRALALASLILAGVAPLLTDSPSANYVGLFSYLFAVIVGAIWIAVITGRRELTAAALILITFYSLPHLFLSTSADKGVLLLFAYAFSAVFFLTNTLGVLKLKGKAAYPDIVTAAGNGLFLLAWIMIAADQEWKSLIISSWMIVFLAGSFMIYRITRKSEAFYIYAGVGIAMLAAATSAELKGATLTIAYTIESGIISLIAYLILRNIKVTERISLLLIGPIILSYTSIVSRAWLTGVIHKDFFVLAVLGSTLLGLGLFFLSRAREIEGKALRQLTAVLLIAGSVYA